MASAISREVAAVTGSTARLLATAPPRASSLGLATGLSTEAGKKATEAEGQAVSN